MNRLEVVNSANFSKFEAGALALSLALVGGITWLGGWLAKKEAERIAAMEKHIIAYRKKNKNCSIVDISSEYGYDIDTIIRVLTINDLLTKKDENYIKNIRDYRAAQSQAQADRMELLRLQSEANKNNATADSIKASTAKSVAGMTSSERMKYYWG